MAGGSDKLASGGLGRIVMIAALSLLLFAAGCGHDSPGAYVVDAEAVRTLRAELKSGAVAAKEEGPAPEPTGFATLSGVFKMVGQPPPPRQLNVTSDQSVCFAGNSEELVVGAGGGIGNVLIYVRKLDPKFVHESKKVLPEPPVFDQKRCLFTTRVLPVVVNQEVILKNSDPVGHNVNIPGTGFNQTISANGESRWKPSIEAPLPISTTCSIHDWMQGYLIPRKNLYVAVTKPDGTFEISDLPSGIPLEFQVWHERAKVLKNVEVNGAPQQWKSGKFTLTLNPGEPYTLAVNLNASLFQ